MLNLINSVQAVQPVRAVRKRRYMCRRAAQEKGTTKTAGCQQICL